MDYYADSVVTLQFLPGLPQVAHETSPIARIMRYPFRSEWQRFSRAYCSIVHFSGASRTTLQPPVQPASLQDSGGVESHG